MPASDILNIQLNNVETGLAVISIYDITGREISMVTHSLHQVNETLALPLPIPNGVYFIGLSTNGNSKPMQKFIKS